MTIDRNATQYVDRTAMRPVEAPGPVGPLRHLRSLSQRRRAVERTPSALASPARIAIQLAPTSHSTIELIGGWFALTVAMSLVFASLGVGVDSFQDLPFMLDAASFFFIGLAPVIATIASASELLPQRRLVRWPSLAVVAVVGTVLGLLAQDGWARLNEDAACSCNPHANQHTLAVFAVFVTVLWEYRRISRRTAAAAYEVDVNRLRVQSELAASRLQVLQAQIEPHFIFNSLANVRRLLRIDGVAGRAMLTDMLRYLESALPRLRDDAPTLGHEVELTRAFLAVHQVRMGERLAVEFDVAPALEARPIPPMMLLTLVENALKHGLNPLPEGGAIRISATRSPDGTLSLSVLDTGRGLSNSLGNGTGLVNIRTRLRAMFGPAAQLTLQTNEPRGVIATLAIPDLSAA